MSNFKREILRIGRQIHVLATPMLASLRWRLAKQFPKNAERHKLSGRLVISLTSYPPRFAKLHLTLKTLLSQSINPDLVVLWVAEQDMDRLPTNVKTLASASFEIRPTKDLKSYKKIVPALAAFPDAFIATADDDLYYRRNWLQNLVDAEIRYPGHIVCHRVHRITQSADGNWQTYRNWPKNFRSIGISSAYFPTCGAGAIYPPNSLAEDTGNETDFMTLAPHADDVWLYWMARLRGTPIFNLASRDLLITWRGSQNSTLYKINVMESQNDTQIAAMGRRYGYPTLD